MKIDLKSERLNRGLSLQALSDETGVSKSALARIENGVEPAPATAFKIATFYERKVTDIWPVETGAAA